MKNYKFDLHIHTTAVSSCANVSPEDMTELYKSAGYDGIVITEHYYMEYFDRLGSIPWCDKMKQYLQGYYRAKEKSHGLQVFLGLEFRNIESTNDFLVFGLSEEFLYAHKELYLLPLQQAFDLFHQNGAVIIQAHPCRIKMASMKDNIIKQEFSYAEMLQQFTEDPNTPCIIYEEDNPKKIIETLEVFSSPVFLKVCNLMCPEKLDGIEVYNGNSDWFQKPIEVDDIIAKHPHFISISSSDFHETTHCGRGGVIFPSNPTTQAELITLLKSKSINQLIKTI